MIRSRQVEHDVADVPGVLEHRPPRRFGALRGHGGGSVELGPDCRGGRRQSGPDLGGTDVVPHEPADGARLLHGWMIARLLDAGGRDAVGHDDRHGERIGAPRYGARSRADLRPVRVSSPAPARPGCSPRSAPRSSASRTRSPGACGTSSASSARTSTATAAPTAGPASSTTTSRSSASPSTCAPSAARSCSAELVRVSNAVTENFAAGVMERLGFGYERLRELRPDVVYVSNCGFGHTGPYRPVQVVGTDRPGRQRAHPHVRPRAVGSRRAGATRTWTTPARYVMAIALLAALYHQRRTGEGQWVDLACIEAGIALTGPAVLDATVNGRTLRDDGAVDSNRSSSPAMAPHGIYPCRERRPVGRRRLPSRRGLGAPRRRHRRVVGQGPRPSPRCAGRLGAPGRRRRRAGRRGPPARGRDDVVDAIRAAGVPVRPGQAPARALRRRRRQRRVGPVADGRPRQARRGARRRPAGPPVGAPTGASSGPARCSGRTTSGSTPRCSA